MFRISVTGHVCVDLVPGLTPAARFAPGQLIHTGPMDVRLGGAVGNTGRALLDLGADVTLQAVVGDDALADLADRLLGDRARLRRLPGAATSYTLVLEPPGSDRTFWQFTGANARFDPTLVSVDTDLLHLGYPPLLPTSLADRAAPLRALFARAREAGVTTSLDLAVVDPQSPVAGHDWGAILDELLPLSDVVSPSVDDLVSMAGGEAGSSLESADAWCAWLLDHGVGVAMVTAGAAGLALRAAGRDRLVRGGRVLASVADAWAEAAVRLPARQAGDATSTGTGDAATAGALYGLAAGWGPGEAAELARSTAEAIRAGRPIEPAGMVV